jgi:hypothetical protein
LTFRFKNLLGRLSFENIEDVVPKNQCKNVRCCVMKQIQGIAIGIALALLSTPVAIALINGRQPTKLTTTPTTGTFGRLATVRAQLTTLDNRPIPGQPVELEILYPTYTTRLGTYYTNNNGVVTATVNLLPYDFPGRGTYNIGWTYRGNGMYSAPIPMSQISVR